MILDNDKSERSSFICLLTSKSRVVTVATRLPPILKEENELILSRCHGTDTGLEFLGKVIKLLFNHTYAIILLFVISCSSIVYLRDIKRLVCPYGDHA